MAPCTPSAPWAACGWAGDGVARSKRKRTGADDSRPQSTPHDKTATEEPVLEDDEDAPIHRSIEALVQSPDDVRKDSSFKEFDQLLLSDETRNWARKLYIYPVHYGNVRAAKAVALDPNQACC